MLKHAANVFHFISIWVIVVPFLAGIINYKGLNRDSKWIFLLVIVAMLPQLLTGIIDEETRLLHFSYNLYTPIEIGILSVVFRPKYASAALRNMVTASVGVFLLFYAVEVFRYGLLEKFLNLSACLCNIIYMLWILLLLKQEYSTTETFITKTNPFTWYLTALALYLPGRMATLALYHFIRDESTPFRLNLSLIDSLFNILLYLFFTVGLLIRKPA